MIIKRYFVLAALVSVGSVLVGCGGSGDNSSDSGDGDGSGDTSTPVDGGGAGTGGSAPEGVTGTWVRGCEFEEDSDVITIYTTSVAVITNSEAAISVNFYSDSGCTIATDPAVIETMFSLEYTGGTTTTNLGDAAHVNITTESATIDGEPATDVLGADAAEQIGLNEIDYDLIIAADGFLYSGDTDGLLNGSTAESRPTTLDTEYVYTRQ